MSNDWIKKDISDGGLGSCTVWHCKAGGSEPKHYHKGLEIVYVLKGNCKTHKQGKVYVYREGDVHEVINDSDKEIVFVVTSIPPWSEENTFYV